MNLRGTTGKSVIRGETSFDNKFELLTAGDLTWKITEIAIRFQIDNRDLKHDSIDHLRAFLSCEIIACSEREKSLIAIFINCQESSENISLRSLSSAAISISLPRRNWRFRLVSYTSFYCFMRYKLNCLSCDEYSWCSFGGKAIIYEKVVELIRSGLRGQIRIDAETILNKF